MKKEKIMNKQTKTAIDTLLRIYNKPDWYGTYQQNQKILEWDNVLKNYSEEQVRLACLHYAKYRKDSKFPSITCLEAELVDVSYDNGGSSNRSEQANRMYAYLLQHANECNPPASELAIKRTIWNMYNISVDGYNPMKDTTTPKTGSPEMELWIKTGKKHPYGAIKIAFSKMIRDFKSYYPELSNSDCSTLCYNMRKNGYWDNSITNYLEA